MVGKRAVVTVLLVVLIMFILPEQFPPYVLPVTYTFAFRQLAKQTQGEAIASHRTAGGKTGSWWAVVGLGLVGLALLMVVTVFILFLFPSAVVQR